MAAGVDHIIRLWDTEKAKLLHEFHGHTDTVNWLNFSSDVRYAVFASDDGTARVWRLPRLVKEGVNPEEERLKQSDGQ